MWVSQGEVYIILVRKILFKEPTQQERGGEGGGMWECLWVSERGDNVI